jgi:hypothetical protein
MLSIKARTDGFNATHAAAESVLPPLRPEPAIPNDRLSVYMLTLVYALTFMHFFMGGIAVYCQTSACLVYQQRNGLCLTLTTTMTMTMTLQMMTDINNNNDNDNDNNNGKRQTATQ